MVSKFTCAIFGKVTTVNNSNNVISAGDTLEWCFYDDTPSTSYYLNRKRGTRHIILRKTTDVFSPYILGYALTTSSPGEHFDVFVNF